MKIQTVWRVQARMQTTFGVSIFWLGYPPPNRAYSHTFAKMQ
uniref:Uncharacterized protein n=1 Tax=Vibrio alginolyticus TaxID=663 RepID=A0A0N7EIJ1_VIBAL|nr:Hypothetical protein ICEValHN396_006 [Vibrio alginolyticus]